jgi:hypothetical protein
MPNKVKRESLTRNAPSSLLHFIRTDGLPLGALIAVQALLIKMVLWRALPSSSGWYMAWARTASSHVPYRDFYVPFPPGALLFEGWLPNRFSSPFVGQDLVHGLLWIFLAVALYSVMRYFRGPSDAFVASTLALTAYFVQPGNIISGYYETMYGFLIAGIALILHSCRTRSNSLMFLGGIFIGLSTTIKQTAWLPALVVLILIFLGERLVVGLTRAPKFLFFLGASIPWLVISIWNVWVGNFHTMWAALLTGGGKGVGQYTFVPMFLQSIVQYRELWIVVLGLVGSHYASQTLGSHYRLSVAAIGVVLAVWLVADVIFPTAGTTRGQGLLLLGTGIAIVWFYWSFCKVEANRISHRYVAVCVLPALIGAFIASRMPSIGGSGNGLLEIDLSKWLVEGGQRLTYSLYGLALVGLGAVLVRLFHLRSSSTLERVGLLVVLSVILALQLFNSFAGSPTLETWLLILPFGVFALIDIFSEYLEGFGTVLCAVLIGIWTPALIQIQSTNPYDWLGMRAAPLDKSSSAPLIQGLHSFRLSSNRSILLSELDRAVRKAGGKKAEVLYGVRNAGLSVVLETRTYPVKCIVSWWDVCPEDLANEDLRQIKKLPPRLVVWTFEDESVLSGNELAWRNGSKSAVREIQVFLDEEIKKGDYTVSLSFPENDDGSGPITKLLVRTN